MAKRPPVKKRRGNDVSFSPVPFLGLVIVALTGLACVADVEALVTPSNTRITASKTKYTLVGTRSFAASAASWRSRPFVSSSSSSLSELRMAVDPAKNLKAFKNPTRTMPISASSTTDGEMARDAVMVGDDPAAFSLSEQSVGDWVKFCLAVAAVLGFVAYMWVLPMGPHGGDVFLDGIQSLTGTTDPAVTVFSMLIVFAFCHSGLAGLRTYAEPIVGPRSWRVLFAVVSLPLALSCISYFINHAHEGVHLWDLTHVPGLHTALWIANFISFLFLYPSTFKLLEVAAIEKPEVRLWGESGIIRITRHPQAVGQVMWCLAHSLWLGTSTALAASSVLVLHHVFAVWHGDRRLQDRHGEDFEYIKSKTSVVPFAAILDGRQELPPDFYKEFLRLPYIVIVGGTVAAYLAHPYMQAGAALLNW